MRIINEYSVIGDETREASFSPCGNYRYRLDICWDSTSPTLCTICLNPSTATHLKDDPTIRIGKAFAKQLGCGSYRMLNLFALRSTDYKALFRAADPIGPENTVDFLRYWADGTIAVAAWGAAVKSRNWGYYRRGDEIAMAVPDLYCWQLTASGAPHHPLRLSLQSELKPYVIQESKS